MIMSARGVTVSGSAIALLIPCAAISLETPDHVSQERTFEFTYSVTVPELTGKADIEVWLPLPLQNERQSVVHQTITTSAPYEIVEEKTYGNRLLKVTGPADELSGATINLQFTVTRRKVEGGYEDDTLAVLDQFRQPNLLVPIDGIIAERARIATASTHDELAAARALYDDVVVNISYDKSGTGWGQGDALYACSIEKGNCTDFHSLFIGMCRSKGIPARFAIGFPLPTDRESGTISGYHCWAEFYVEGKGWIPVDASEASKHPEWTEFYFGNLDANRVEFTRGRDFMLPSSADLAPRNYFIYPVLVVDGKEREGLKHEFRFSNVTPKK